MKHENLNTLIICPFRNTCMLYNISEPLFLRLLFILPPQLTSHNACLPLDASYVVGWDIFTWRRNANQSVFCYPHFLSQIHRAGLLVQEGDCSAHFNMNTVFLYLVAICFPVIKYPQPAFSFFQCQ